MSYRKIKFINDNYYHIYNRGVDKRKIFDNEKDFERFLDCLRFFNSTNSIWLANKTTEDRPRGRQDQKLVDIVCYCLMPNHFHLLLKQRLDNGISIFMKKISTGYAMYFNITRNRNGILFQGRYKANIIKDDNYLTHLSRYIHLNPIELIDKNWKIEGLKDRKKAFEFLYKYPWSSYGHYIGSVNNDLIDRNLLQEIFSNKEYEEFTKSWMVKESDFLESIEDRPQKIYV